MLAEASVYLTDQLRYTPSTVSEYRKKPLSGITNENLLSWLKQF